MTDIDDEALAAAAALSRAEQLASSAGGFRKTYRHGDFLYDTSQDAFWCRPTGAMICGEAVNSLIPMASWRQPPTGPNGRIPALVPPAKDIKRIEGGTVIEASTWMPGQPDLISDLFVSREGFFELEGARIYNVYRAPPGADLSLAKGAGPWIELVKKLWPEIEEHNYFFDYCAHMVQRPNEKSNAAIVMSGKQGIGKDTVLATMREVVGNWNSQNISPDALLEKFNPWVQTVMLVVDEVRPMSNDYKATDLYNVLKTLTASPPNTLPLNDKRDKVRYVANVLRVMLTTNDRLALYIPPEDRRILMLHSDLQKGWHIAAGDPKFFTRFFAWIEKGGAACVRGWLAARDISAYDPKGEVPQTAAWAEIGQRWEAPEDELTQALEMLGEPIALFSAELQEQIFDGSNELFKLMKGRSFVWRMQQAGYKLVPHPRGQNKWRKREGDWEFQSNKAYIKESLGLGPKAAMQAVTDRLHARVAVGRNGRVPKDVHLKVVK